MLRTSLQADCHRLANYLEGHLADVLRELLAASMIEEAQDITYNGCQFIKALREARDAQPEGGDV